MSNDDLQKALQPLPPMLNHVIAKAICEDLPRQRRNSDARRLALKNIAEVFKIAVATPNAAVLEFEGGDVGAANNLVVGIHSTPEAMGRRILDLLIIRADYGRRGDYGV